MLPNLHEAGEEILVVGDVEVPCQEEVPRHPVALPHDRVAPVDAVVAVRPVAHVAQEELSRKGNVLLDPIGIYASPGPVDARPVSDLHARFWRCTLELLVCHLLDPLEDVLDRIFVNGLLAVNIPRTRRHVELDAGHTAAILPAVALLLHHQIHAVEAEETCAILLLVVLGRLQETKQREAALVMRLVTHGEA